MTTMIKRALFMTALAVTVPAAAFAQNESALKEALEGRTMVLRIDMPATQLGIDVYPERRMPIDFSEVGKRVKTYGTGIHQGESQTITTIKVKDDHIEVQLGGGGFGTLADRLANPTTVITPQYFKTSRERDLESRLKYENDWRERSRIQRELDDIKRDRNTRNATAAVANRMAQEQVRERRVQGGSRFNVRFDGKFVPSEFLTPDGIIRALAKYGQVMGADDQHGEEYQAPVAAAAKPMASTGSISSLKKGMTLQDVEKTLGPASAISKKNADTLVIEERTYNVGERVVIARFASGVMIEYLIKSKD